MELKYFDDLIFKYIGRAVLKWQDTIPPYCGPRALQVVSVARSYYSVAHETSAARRLFIYSGGQTFLDDGQVNVISSGDDNGGAKIDCSTYVHLVLRGIRYSESPYNQNLPNNMFLPDNLQTNTVYPWVEDALAKSYTMSNTLLSKDNSVLVRYAADLAAFYWAAGRVFPYKTETIELIRPGDLVFYYKDINRFMHITHVGIVEEDPAYMFNVMADETTENIHEKSVVAYSHVVQPNRNIAFFARPDYGNQAQAFPFSTTNYLQAPWQLREKEIVDSVVALPDLYEGTVWTGTDGGLFVSSNRIIDLADADHPIYLPKGIYRLTGAPAHPDRRSNFNRLAWGIRISRLSSETIQSTVYGYNNDSCTGTISALQRNSSHVWDIGYGAEFTLENGRLLKAAIVIPKYPVRDDISYENTCPTVDIWRPRLIRIGDYTAPLEDPRANNTEVPYSDEYTDY